MNDDGTYIAFIAYRHTHPDRQWAKWLHHDLETYRLPQRVVKPGMPLRLGRVFRDEEELSASADLSESIKTALQRSRWLVVVCSPRTPEAAWINDEIRQFRATRTEPPSRVLTLLVEGDPATAFPPALRPDEPALRGRQPAAADVRPSDGLRTRDLRRTALLKIAAELAGVPYDALRQRDDERSRRRRRNWTIGLGTAALVFLGLSMVAGYQWYQARSRERAALAQNAVWQDPAAAAQFASQAWCASRTTESRDAVDAVLRESNVVAVWSDPDLAPIKAAGFNVDATRVIFSTAANEGWVWDWRSCEAIHFPNYAMLSLRSTAMGADGLVASEEWISRSSHDLLLRSASSAAVSGTIHGTSGWGAITAAAFSPDSRYLATGSFDAMVRIWNVKTPANGPDRTFDVGVEPVASVRFNPAESAEGTYELVAAGHDGRARVWQFSNDKRRPATGPELLRPGTTALFDAIFNPKDPDLIAAAGQEGKVFLGRRHNAKWTMLDNPIWVGGFEVREVGFSHNGDFIVTASADNIARVWDWSRHVTDATAKPVRELYGHRGAVTAAEFSFDSTLIVTASTDGTVRVWRNESTVSQLSARPSSHACGWTTHDRGPRASSRRSAADTFTMIGCFFNGPN